MPTHGGVNRSGQPRSNRRRHGARTPSPVERAVTITRIGARGDGLSAEPPPIHVPFTLPGEIARVAVCGDRGALVEIIAPSDQRITPICRHFGVCGGCALQHWQTDSYRGWKRGLLVAQLRAHGVDADVGETVAAPVASRRRAVFTALGGARPEFGFQAARSHRLVDIVECPVLAPPLQMRLAALRALAVALGRDRKPLRMTVTVADNGIDVAIAGRADTAAADPAIVIERAQAAGVIRLTADGDLIYRSAVPELAIDGLPVAFPPGGFVQACRETEHAMQRLVLAACAGARSVADLFCGLGTFALPLSRTAHVHAVDSDTALLAALDNAWRRAPGRKPVRLERRDLLDFPLQPDELDRFDAVVFDPARAGAAAQAATLAAASRVATVVAVSCHPRTLARDLAILASGGYKITQVTPLDQFVFSSHIEAVAVLRRDA